MPGLEDVLVRKGGAVDLLPIQVAGARFSGMKRGTNHKVGEIQPLKGLAHQWIAKRSLCRSDGRLPGSSIC